MTNSPASKIFEALIEPHLEVGSMTIDGAPFVRLWLDHPRHGPIEVILGVETAQSIGSLLCGSADKVADARGFKK